MFSTSFPELMQFARLGYVIGHENTHAFDNSGQLWNSNGEFIPIMDLQSSDAFNKQAQCLIDQYDNFEVFVNHCFVCIGFGFTDGICGLASCRIFC